MPRATSKQTASVSRRRGKSATARPLRQNSEELMELAVDAAQSRHLPEFLERFASLSLPQMGEIEFAIVGEELNGRYYAI